MQNDRRKKTVFDYVIPFLLSVLIAVGSVVGSAVTGAIKDLTDQVRILSGKMAAVEAIQNVEKEQRVKLSDSLEEIKVEQNAIRDIINTDRLVWQDRKKYNKKEDKS